jgi:hypothetical protein
MQFMATAVVSWSGRLSPRTTRERAASFESGTGGTPKQELIEEGFGFVFFHFREARLLTELVVSIFPSL